VKMLESMADVFSKLPSDDKKLSGMVSEASTNLIHGMGNVLDTFSHTAAEETEKKDQVTSNKTNTEESKVFIMRTIKENGHVRTNWYRFRCDNNVSLHPCIY